MTKARAGSFPQRGFEANWVKQKVQAIENPENEDVGIFEGQD